MKKKNSRENPFEFFYEEQTVASENSNGLLLTILQDQDEQPGDEVKGKATSDLDPKNLKVTELRSELASRNLSTKGKIYE